KGPTHIYEKETPEQKREAQKALEAENQENRRQREELVLLARRALRSMGDSEVNSKKHSWTKKHELKRGDRTRGGVDGWRHREEVLKPKLVPFIKHLRRTGHNSILLKDGAPSHTSKIATEYLSVSHIEKLRWPGHSPDVNAEEHAWPWIRRHITKDFKPSTCAGDCKAY
ncbi:hypothetical protein BU23DRAFT_448804, partial [Bimuria novae-zelandiae CBS 107.79]